MSTSLKQHAVIWQVKLCMYISENIFKTKLIKNCMYFSNLIFVKLSFPETVLMSGFPVKKKPYLKQYKFTFTILSQTIGRLLFSVVYYVRFSSLKS